jgi:predicted DNA-binding ribbon-helix-helix protein
VTAFADSMDDPHIIRKRSVRIAGHRTSLSLEAAFWDQLKRIAAERGLSLNRLVAEIDGARSARSAPANLSSAIRVYILKQLGERR